jgi:hypothetical protein
LEDVASAMVSQNNTAYLLAKGWNGAWVDANARQKSAVVLPPLSQEHSS